MRDFVGSSLVLSRQKLSKALFKYTKKKYTRIPLLLCKVKEYGLGALRMNTQIRNLICETYDNSVRSPLFQIFSPSFILSLLE